MQHLAPAMTTLVACSRTCWARDYPVGRCMLGQKDGCGADHDTELQRGAAPDLWQGGLGHNPLQRGAAPDLCQESTAHNPLQYCATSAFSNRRSIPGLPSGTQEYIRTAFRYPGVYPDCLQVPRSIPGLPSGTQEYADLHARHLGSEISDCGVRVGPGYRETIPNQGVAFVHGQGSLAHECNEGVALVHGQGARVACQRRHTVPGLPSGTQEYTRTAFRYPGVYPLVPQNPLEKVGGFTPHHFVDASFVTTADSRQYNAS